MIPQAKRDSYQPRKPADKIGDTYEDAGLFKTGICQVMIELIPLMHRNERGDLIVRGFIDRKTEIDIFFAGRRVFEVGPLVKHLRSMLETARQAATSAGEKQPKIENVRLPVRIEGAWRRSTQRDESGWETGTYQFVAARWSLLDVNGNTVSYGYPPEV
jgi:hypothetical protein